MTPDLSRIASVYAQAYVWYTVNGATPRGTGRVTNKPGSKPPSGADRQLRACLVETARAISDATWHLSYHRWPTKPWRPVSFVTQGKLTVFLGRPWTEVVARHVCADCDKRWAGEDTPHTHGCKHPEEQINLTCEDRWAPDPDDMAVMVQHPHQVEWECQRLQGHLGMLATRGADDVYVVRAVEALRRAERAMRRAGMWERPREVQRAVCAHCTERDPETGRKWCAACRRSHQPDRRSCRVCDVGEDEVA